MTAPQALLSRALVDDAADTVRGIIFGASAYFVMTAGDVAAKWVLPMAGVGAIMLSRGIVGTATVALVARAQSGPGDGTWRRLVPQRRGLVLLRSVLAGFVSLAWYMAWQTMSLPDSYAIGFAAPLLMTVLAVPMLAERIRWRRALSTAIGFCGVLVMLRPGGDLWTPAAALLLAGAAGMAVTRILTRLLSTTETPECLAFWLLLAHLPVGMVLMATVFPVLGTVTIDGWLALAFLGIANGIGQCLHARSYALAPVSALAPYEYTMLLWGGMFGFLVFGDVPSWTTLAGAAVVAAAGLYNLHRERVRRDAEASCQSAQLAASAADD